MTLYFIFHDARGRVYAVQRNNNPILILQDPGSTPALTKSRVNYITYSFYISGFTQLGGG